MQRRYAGTAGLQVRRRVGFGVGWGRAGWVLGCGFVCSRSRVGASGLTRDGGLFVSRLVRGWWVISPGVVPIEAALEALASHYTRGLRWCRQQSHTRLMVREVLNLIFQSWLPDAQAQHSLGVSNMFAQTNTPCTLPKRYSLSSHDP